MVKHLIIILIGATVTIGIMKLATHLVGVPYPPWMWLFALAGAALGRRYETHRQAQR